jgi:hypothetical protein
MQCLLGEMRLLDIQAQGMVPQEIELQLSLFMLFTRVVFKYFTHP